MVQDFHSLKLSGSDKLFRSHGSQQEVRVEGQQNIIDRIRLEVSNGSWDIRTKGCIRQHKQLLYYIILPDVRSLSLSGSREIMTKNRLISSNIDFDVTGSGSITAEVEAVIDGEVIGSGKLTLRGESESLELEITGSCELDAFDLHAKDAKVAIRGSGDAYIRALNKLEVAITGSGNAYCKGSPIISTSISGSGQLISRN